MIEVEMSKDIRDCEPKLLGPFTKRQILFVSLGLVIGVPVFFVLPKSLSLVLRIVIGVICAAPVFVCGFLDMFGYHFEQFVIHLYKNIFKKPRLRLYEGTCVYQDIEEEMFPQTATDKKKKTQKFKQIDVLDSQIKPPKAVDTEKSVKSSENSIKKVNNPKEEKREGE